MEKEELKATLVLKIVCFFIPLVGLIIYACNVANNKKYANQCGIASLIGFITSIMIIIAGFGINKIMNSGQIKEAKPAYNNKYEENEEEKLQEFNRIMENIDI